MNRREYLRRASTLGAVAVAVLVSHGADDMSAEAIVNGVHGYMPDNYVVPKEPEVRERLEWFLDQKLALMMHFGMYSQMGVYESWPLSDSDSSWSRVQVDWTDNAEDFKRQFVEHCRRAGDNSHQIDIGV